MKRNEAILALDVGGSSIKSGLVSGDSVVNIKNTPIDSKGDSETIITTFSDIINRNSATNQISGIAFSMPGPFDHTKGISYMGPNQGKYEAIYGMNLKELILDRVSTDYPITFRDDGESAIVGEALYGAGKPFGRLIGITLGTGIGSAFIINGEPQYKGKGIPENLLYDCLWKNKRADEVFSIRG
ncbi:MAG: ROK family protein, partial [Eudoraea sp.]|nr:ROK family protein [Eudoraea sp.]